MAFTPVRLEFVKREGCIGGEWEHVLTVGSGWCAGRGGREGQVRARPFEGRGCADYCGGRRTGKELLCGAAEVLGGLGPARSPHMICDL